MRLDFCLILNFLPLVLIVLLNFISNTVLSSIGINKTLLKESLELVLRQGSFRCLVMTLVPMQERQNCIGMVEVGGNDGMY